MRRPLWNTGLPQVAQTFTFLASETPNIILDLSEVPEEMQDRTYVVTLFAIAEQGGLIDPINAAVQDSEDNYYPIYTGLPYFASATGAQKILDRFPLRGDMKLVAGTPGGGDPIWFFGYYEIDGREPADERFRPFEPTLGSVGNNVDPFTYTPVTIDSVITETRVHAFSSTYIDEVNMYVAAFDPGFFGGVSLIFVDGEDTATMLLSRSIAQAYSYLESIPFRAASSNAVGGRLPGIYLAATVANCQAAAWGNFRRF